MNIVYAPAPVPNQPGVYVDIVAPPPAQNLNQTPIAGFTFEGNRGEVDVAYDLSSLADFEYFFGKDGYDASGKPLSGHLAARHLFEVGTATARGVRVAGATLAEGYLLVKNATAAMVALHASTAGSWAQSLEFVITQNTGNSTWNLTVSNTANPTEAADVFTNLPYTNNATLISTINATARLIYATQPVLQEMSAAPTVTAAGTGGTLAQGTYYGLATYVTAGGVETQASPETAAIALTAGQTLTVSVPTALGASKFNYYMTPVNGVAGSEVYAGQGTPGTNLVISAPPAASTQAPPHVNAAVTGAGDTSALPTAGTFTIASTQTSTSHPGADGANPGAARHLGATNTGPGGGPSGAYALFGFDQDPELVFMAGTPGTDTTQWASFGALCSGNGALGLVGFAPGTTSAAAKTAVEALSTLIAPNTTAGLALAASWPCATVNDPVVGAQTVPSQAYFAGMMAVTPRQVSPANKPIQPGTAAGAIGFSFTGTDIKATATDVTTLDDTSMGVYVNVLTARIPSRGTGWFSANTLAPEVAGSEFGVFNVRVQNYLARVLYVQSGAYYQEPIDDALMAQAQLDCTGLLDQLAAPPLALIPQNDAGAATAAPSPPVTTAKSTRTTTSAAKAQPVTVNQPQPGSGQYVAYLVTCDRSVNTPATIAAGDFIIVVQCAIKPNARRVILQLNAGVNVQISTASGAVA